MGLKLNLVEHHLHYPEKRELVHSVLDGRFKRYYQKDALGTDDKKEAISAPDKPIVGLPRQPIPFRMIILLTRSGVMAHRELADVLRKSPSTISHHLEKLMAADVVAKSPDGRDYRLSDSARMERMLVPFNPQPQTLADGFIEI